MAYNDQKNDLQLWLKSFFGLSFIAPDDVENAFVELISTCPNIADGHLFSDYVLETYVESGCLFPPILWAETPSLNPRYIFTNKSKNNIVYYIHTFSELQTGLKVSIEHITLSLLVLIHRHLLL